MIGILGDRKIIDGVLMQVCPQCQGEGVMHCESHPLSTTWEEWTEDCPRGCDDGWVEVEEADEAAEPMREVAA